MLMMKLKFKHKKNYKENTTYNNRVHNFIWEWYFCKSTYYMMCYLLNNSLNKAEIKEFILFVSDQDDTKVVPSINRVFLGDDATFRCLSFGETSWFHGLNFENVIELRSLNRVFDIESVTVKDNGIYYCHGGYYSDWSTKFLSKSVLKVYRMPYVTS